VRPRIHKPARPARPQPRATTESTHIRAARRTAAIVWNATTEAQKSKLPQMAAALAFRTIFGLIPVVVVGLVALRFFYTDEDIAGVLNRAMDYSGISAIAVDPSEMGPFPEWDPRSQPQQGSAETPHATGSTRLDEWVGDLVNRVSTVNLRAISAIGIIFVIYAAIAMLVEIERAFNQIYRVPIGRSWVRRITQYWTMLTLGTLGLAATFYVGQKFNDWISHTAAFSGAQGQETFLIAAVGYFTTVTISTAVLLLLYMSVPNTKVKLWPALAGAFLAALTWEAGKWGFTQYLHYSAFYARLYGSIALIPLFLLWVYLTWIIVLVGLQSAYYLQHGRFNTVPQPAEMLETGIVDASSSLLVMGGLARRFEDGQPASARELAELSGMQEGVARQILSALAEAGLVLRIPGEDEEEPAYTLARPADRISAEEVLKIGEALASPGGGQLSSLAEQMRASRLELVRNRSVAAVLGMPVTAVGDTITATPAEAAAGFNVDVTGGREPSGASRVDLA